MVNCNMAACAAAAAAAAAAGSIGGWAAEDMVGDRENKKRRGESEKKVASVVRDKTIERTDLNLKSD